MRTISVLRPGMIINASVT